MSNTELKRKGRDLAITVKDLLDSPRLKVAVIKYASGDKSFLQALLTELGMEAESVGKYAVIRKYQSNSGLSKPDLMVLLNRVGLVNSDDRTSENIIAGMPKKDFNEMNTYNIFWNLSKQEAKYWLAKEMNPNISEEEVRVLLDAVLRRFGLDPSS